MRCDRRSAQIAYLEPLWPASGVSAAKLPLRGHILSEPAKKLFDKELQDLDRQIQQIEQEAQGVGAGTYVCAGQ